ncbi:MAG: hypothetical protein ACQEW5_27815 [Bacillota bacterium]
MDVDKKEKKTFIQKLGVGFTIFTAVYIILKITGLFEPVIEFIRN